jgi:dTDP-4-dehydrorhamnose 3,5-epimerase
VLFEPTSINGAFLIKLSVHEDERGSFARTFCQQTFAQMGIDLCVSQVNVSRNPTSETLRGMHYQISPHEEPKLVQCIRGRIFDVAIDLRYSSPSYMSTVYTELSESGNRLFFIPAGCAHGFLTLRPNTDILYYMGAPFSSSAARGVRWNDPSFEIPWPKQPRVISARDATFPSYRTPDEAGV